MWGTAPCELRLILEGELGGIGLEKKAPRKKLTTMHASWLSADPSCVGLIGKTPGLIRVVRREAAVGCTLQIRQSNSLLDLCNTDSPLSEFSPNPLW